MDHLKKTKLDDFYAKGYIRADGQYVHDMYLVQVKSPAESKVPWDYVKVVATMPGEVVFIPKPDALQLVEVTLAPTIDRSEPRQRVGRIVMSSITVEWHHAGIGSTAAC